MTTHIQKDNTKRRAGELEDHVSNYKTWIFSGPASCTKFFFFWRAAWIFSRPAGCTIWQSSSLHAQQGGLADCTLTWACHFLQPCTLLADLPKIHEFLLETRPSSPPTPLALYLVQGFPTFLWPCTLSAFGQTNMYPFNIAKDKYACL